MRSISHWIHIGLVGRALLVPGLFWKAGNAPYCRQAAQSQPALSHTHMCIVQFRKNIFLLMIQLYDIIWYDIIWFTRTCVLFNLEFFYCWWYDYMIWYYIIWYYMIHTYMCIVQLIKNFIKYWILYDERMYWAVGWWIVLKRWQRPLSGRWIHMSWRWPIKMQSFTSRIHPVSKW